MTTQFILWLIQNNLLLGFTYGLLLCIFLCCVIIGAIGAIRYWKGDDTLDYQKDAD
jgi:hypothetical protein